MLHSKSITWRWVRGNLLLTIAVLLAAECIFIFSLRSSFYSSVRTSIMSRLNTLEGQLSVTAQDPDTERSQALRRLAEDFEEKDQFEFMLLDGRGKIVATSSGVIPQYADGLDDFARAQESADGVGQCLGSGSDGEHLMSICWMIPNPAGGISAVRMVTGLELVDQQIELFVFLSLGVVLLVVFFSVMSGTYFIRSIVLPLGKVEQTATSIAAGNFNARIEPQTDDEIGRLCTTINDMAKELGKTEQLKNEFISSVSHELRTPLTSIKGWTETLAVVQNPADQNFKRGLSVIGQETERLSKMVEELLDFSRLQNGGVRLEGERLDLVAEVADVLLMVGQRAEQEKVSLQFDEPQLPYPVFADKNRLRQVFLNLLDNALKYSPPGGVIKVEISAAGPRAQVSIADQGPGIRPEDLGNVKQKFYKGQGAVRGSGIGLAVVDELVAMHGGSFEVESSYGYGTRVVVQLPLVQANSHAGALPSQKADKTKPAARSGKDKK
ncbi:MAG: HAMP domain-containing histidine kinase [Pygmaiobacter massiliensis]|nr:HAMP domain-containing histidine kinase [Pygmaiobacter massiliensis]